MRRLPPPSVVYLAVFYLISLVCLLGSPIVPGDTDLWYHLNGGRYLVTHRAIPSTSFFSFVSPPRMFVDYYWLFQALVYALYTSWNYYGLIVLRSLMYVVTIGLILRVLFRPQDTPRPIPWLVFLSVCYGLILVPRFSLVRPHLFTYAFIAGCVYLFECRPQRLRWLPVMAVLWCNLHGIAYPILLLILGAYLLEWMVLHALRRPLPEALSGRAPALAFLAMAAVLLTPHGLHLLRVPFISTANASRYIMELRPVELSEVLSSSVVVLASSYQTIFQVVLLVSGLAVMSAWWTRSLRLSHAVLALGGVVLLTKGWRFTSEFALLALPLVASHPVIRARMAPQQVARPVYLACMGLMMMLPLCSLLGGFDFRLPYPFAPRKVPQGAVTFLKQVDVGGRLLNHPDPGGYLQWMLYPRYRIFSDMQVPFLFTDEDMYVAMNMFAEDATLRRLLAHYQPAFLTVPQTAEDFPSLIRQFPEYAMVFFDDAEVLYVDRQQHPALAAQFELRVLDPFTLATQSEAEVFEHATDLEGMMREAARMLAVYPECAILNHLVAATYLREDAYDRALAYADGLVRSFPERPVGYRVRGDALKGLKLFDRALAAYQRALERTSPEARPAMTQKIGQVYLAQGRYAKAYRLLKRSVEVFSARTPRETLYDLAVSARGAGHPAEAHAILRYLSEYEVAPGETEWVEKLTAGAAAP